MSQRCPRGRVLGHEAVGTVVETGSAVSSLKEGDRVLVPAVTSCGSCLPCKQGMAAHCEAVGGIGWIFGHLIDGVQAEFARVPTPRPPFTSCRQAYRTSK
jgi:alcohol dehydrogenase